MYDFKTILVALDLSEMDKYILKYTADLCDFVNPKKVYFINIQKNLDLSEEDKAMVNIASGTPADEHYENLISEEIKEHFPNAKKYDAEIEIIEGNPSEEILKWSKIKKTDLLIMGRKKELFGEGIAPQQIASKVNSSILLVPEGVSDFRIKNIFIPLNFSKETKLALEEAISMQEKTAANLDINCHYIYKLPLGHEKSGKSDDEFANIIEHNASKKFKKLKLEIGKDAAKFDYSTSLLKEGNIAKELNKKANEIQSDLILMGAKSKTLAAQLFLGNTTKKMIINDSTIPLLIVKDKKDTFDFWDFFSKM